jgi:hypothetical protein
LLQIFKHARQWKVGATIDNQAHGALFVVVFQQENDGLGEVRIAQVPARNQEVSGGELRRLSRPWNSRQASQQR